MPAPDDWRLIDRLLALALEEDIGPGDATTAVLVKPGQTAAAAFVAREGGVMAGGAVLRRLLRHLDADGRPRPPGDDSAVEWRDIRPDGTLFQAGDVLARIDGAAAAILAAERTALNLLQRLCAVATRTRDYVDAIAHTRAAILDTRKTCPGHRALDKYAVRAGGGVNHRLGLYDMVLVKDNHLLLTGSPAEAVRLSRARAGGPLPVMVEVDNSGQLRAVLPAEPDYVLLDNMDAAELARAVAIVDETCHRDKLRRPLLEASGGVRLATVAAIAESGVDRISVGALTQGVPAIDIGLDFGEDWER